MDVSRQKGADEVDGWADGRTRAEKWTGGWANEFKESERQTSGRGRTGGRASGWVDGGADGRTGWRTVADRFLKGKTPKLTRKLTWPLEIQRGRPQVIVQLCHLPPLSR